MLAPIRDIILENELIELKNKIKFQENIIKQQAMDLNRLFNDLEKAKNNYSELYQLNTEYYFTIDENFIIQNINYSAASFLGSVSKLLCGTSLLVYFNEYGKTLFKQNVQILLETRISHTFDAKVFLKNVGKQHLRWNLHLDSNKHIFINAKNLTVNLRLEGTIIDLEQTIFHSNTLLQHCTDAIAVLNNNCKFILFNRAFSLRVKEIFKQEITSEMDLNGLLNRTPHWIERFHNTLLLTSKGPQRIRFEEDSMEDQTGTQLCFEFYVQSITNKSGAREYILTITNIQTQRNDYLSDKQQDGSLEIYSPSSTLTELTSALAHEINQPLTAIRAYARGCLLRAEQKADLKEFLYPLEQISMQTTYASAVAQRMKHFMCPNNLHLEPTDLNELIKKTTTFLYYDRSLQKFRIQFKFAPELPLIQVDQLKIMQVLLNLGHNSIDAFQSCNQTSPSICIETKLQKGNIVVHFRDSGPGVPPEISDKIFTPYFTTKTQGTGLGLSISRSFIEAHEGEFALHPYPQDGAWFYFTLPMHKRAAVTATLLE